jgi:uncharacterized protein (UPF0335 family)
MTERVAKDQLKSFIERIERLEEEKKSLADDIRDVYAEAKANGFDTKALREIIKRRTWDRDELAEHDATVDSYKLALGMLVDTPLGEAAIKRASEGTSENVTRDTLTNPKNMPSKKAVRDAADRAEARARPCAAKAEVIRSDPIAGWSSPEARQAHNLEVVSSNLTPASSSRGSVYREHEGPDPQQPSCRAAERHGPGAVAAPIAGLAPGPRETTPAHAREDGPPFARPPVRTPSAGGARPRLGVPLGGAEPFDDGIPNFLRRAPP